MKWQVYGAYSVNDIIGIINFYVTVVYTFFSVQVVLLVLQELLRQILLMLLRLVHLLSTIIIISIDKTHRQLMSLGKLPTEEKVVP